MLVNAIHKSVAGTIGELRKHGGQVYRKSANGKWQLLPSTRLKRDIARLYKNGGTLRSVASELNLTLRFVQQVVDAEGLNCGKAALRDKNKALLESNKDRILKLYKRGDSSSDIARQLGITSGVGRYIKQIGIKRSHGEQHLLSRAKYGKNYTDGMWALTERAIAKRSQKTEFSSYSQYRQCIVKLTYLIMEKYWHLVDPKRRQSVHYNIDHQFSKFYGWYDFSIRQERMCKRKTPVPLTIICHPANLKLLPAEMNSAKGNMCHLSLSALKRRIREFDSKHGKVFK